MLLRYVLHINAGTKPCATKHITKPLCKIIEGVKQWDLVKDIAKKESGVVLCPVPTGNMGVPL